MITLSTIVLIATIYGWIKRYNESVKGTYKLNPFEHDVTIPALMLVIGSILSLFIITFLSIKYLP